MMERKSILVTGASSGIGMATCHFLLRHGYTVHACARRIDRMDALKSAGATTHFLDLSDSGSCEHVIREVGHIDALVNNAGYGLYGSVEDVSLEEAMEQFQVNLFGLARLTQLLIPGMRESRSGTIVNISSVGGRIYTPLGAWYHSSKHALEGWSDCLRLELEDFGIRVVVIEPGAIQTEFTEGLTEKLLDRSHGGPYEDFAIKMSNATRRTFESGKATHPDKVAEVILRAIESARPKSRYVVGHLARPMILLRRVLSDRAFDWLLRKFM